MGNSNKIFFGITIVVFALAGFVGFIGSSVYAATLTNGMNANYVMGQANFTSNTSATTQSGLYNPPRSAYDSRNNRLFVADSGNNRVLVYNIGGGTITNGMNASYVLGQTNFTNNTPATTQNGLYSPSGAAYDSTNNRLFVADSGNNRVLVYNIAPGPIPNGMNASYVLGQANFTTSTGEGAVTQNGLYYPSGVAYDATNDRLFVSDTNHSRIIVYNVASGTLANGMNASYVIGQANFTNGLGVTTQNGLRFPQDAAYDSMNSRLFVADTNNFRVMVYNVAPGTIANGMNASYVLGQTNFTNNWPAISQNGFFYTVGVTYDPTNNRLFVADYYNNRVMVFNAAFGAITNGMNASYVLGQANFTSNTLATTQSGLHYPYGAAYDSTNNRLFVSDRYNNRVMVWEFSVISSVALSSTNGINSSVPLSTSSKADATYNGSVSDTVNYTFWWSCNDPSTDVVYLRQASVCGDPTNSTYGAKYDNQPGGTATTSLTSSNHVYVNGVYHSKVVIERGSAAAKESRITITVTNNPPSVSNIVVAQPNYCFFGPGNIVIVSWNYSDPNGDAQAAYRVLVDDDSSFSSPGIDTGIVNSSNNSYSNPNGLDLNFGTTYKARVYVEDARGASNFNTSGSWTTPTHAYPVVDFNISPAKISVNQNVQFTDATTFYDGAGPGQHNWSWLFCDDASCSSSTTSTLTNPTHTWPVSGIYNVTDTATDKNGYTCSLSKLVTIQKLIPIWKEVSH